jgi:hypothetical protein
MREPFVVTTSWDDGHPLDLRLAGLLAKYQLPATFYVPIENDGRPVLAPADLRGLAAAGFEIGGHTYHHTRLLNVPPAKARTEIESGKAALEDQLGQPITAFCYVGGQHSPALAGMVRRAGFTGARTSVRYRLWRPAPQADRFAVPTTLQARPLTRREDALQLLWARSWGGLLHVAEGNPLDVFGTARRWLGRARRHGGVWHLWGHSWEIEKFNLWADLERVFALAADTRNQARWLTNGQLFAEAARQ